MGRINIELPPDLHKRMKVYCATKSLSVKDFVRDVIRNRVGG